MLLQSQTNGIIKESITDCYYQNCQSVWGFRVENCRKRNKKVTESINCGTRHEKREMDEIENEWNLNRVNEQRSSRNVSAPVTQWSNTDLREPLESQHSDATHITHNSWVERKFAILARTFTNSWGFSCILAWKTKESNSKCGKACVERDVIEHLFGATSPPLLHAFYALIPKVRAVTRAARELTSRWIFPRSTLKNFFFYL